MSSMMTTHLRSAFFAEWLLSAIPGWEKEWRHSLPVRVRSSRANCGRGPRPGHRGAIESLGTAP